MKTNESKVARQYRIQQWAELIKACNNRPADLSIKDWCNQNDITPANYYYRLREVRKVYLAAFPQEQEAQQLVPISMDLTSGSSTQEAAIEIMVNDVRIRVTDHTSPELLSMVMQVAANVK